MARVLAVEVELIAEAGNVDLRKGARWEEIHINQVGL